MSNETNDNIMDEVQTYVDNVWVLPNRPDLESDCIEYVYENYIDSECLRPKAEIVIEFLSKHCADAVSSDCLLYTSPSPRDS